MSVSIQRYRELKPKEARDLAEACRGKFKPGQLRNYEDWTYVLQARDTPEGPTTAFLLLDASEETPAATIRVVCAKEKQTGLPQMLFKRAEDIAREEGNTSLELELLDLEPSLIGVYKDMGFQQDLKDPYAMRKPIPPRAGSRLNVQRRRTQRNRRNRKGRKFRKFPTRRR